MMVTCPIFYQQLCAQMKYVEQSSEDIITFNVWITVQAHPNML